MYNDKFTIFSNLSSVDILVALHTFESENIYFEISDRSKIFIASNRCVDVG